MKRNSLVFKDRLSLDDCDVAELSEFEKRRDPSMQRAFRVRCMSRNKCYVLATRSVDEKNQWLATFSHLQHQHHLQQHQQHYPQHQQNHHPKRNQHKQGCHHFAQLLAKFLIVWLFILLKN